MTNKYVKELVGFINVYQLYPKQVSTSGGHHLGVVGALETTQIKSVLWAYTDYDWCSVASCRGMYPTVYSVFSYRGSYGYNTDIT
jgi:hypothetical protein